MTNSLLFILVSHRFKFSYFIPGEQYIMKLTQALVIAHSCTVHHFIRTLLEMISYT